MSVKIPSTTVLSTERCRIRYPAAADIPHLWSAHQYEGFNDGLSGRMPDSIDQLAPALERNFARWQMGTNYTWTIESRVEREFVGRVALSPHIDVSNVLDIGFWIHPTQQRRGYACESAKALLRFGFDVLGADAVVSAAARFNVASCGVLEKIGMRRVGETEQGFQRQGVWIAVYDYAIAREEYYASNCT